MKKAIFTIDKSKVYDEVAKTTSYTGAKMPDDAAYDRIFTTDEDGEMLARFWEESKALALQMTKRWLLSESEADDVWSLELGLSQSWDEALQGDMARSLFSFFVMNITAKWFTFTNKDEAAPYASVAGANLDDMLQKIYNKKAPIQPVYEEQEAEEDEMDSWRRLLLGGEGRHRKRTIRITIHLRELMYDIQNRSKLVSDARKAAGMDYAVADAMIVTEDPDRYYQIRRAITSSVAALRSATTEYLSEYATEGDNLINNGEIVFAFDLPANFDRAAVEMLGKGIHDYLVSSALGEWFTMSSKDDADIYTSEAETAGKLVREALSRRERPRRPVYRDDIRKLLHGEPKHKPEPYRPEPKHGMEHIPPMGHGPAKPNDRGYRNDRRRNHGMQRKAR